MGWTDARDLDPGVEERVVVAEARCEAQHRLQRLGRFGPLGDQAPLAECRLRIARPFEHLREAAAPGEIVRSLFERRFGHATRIREIRVADEYVEREGVRRFVVRSTHHRARCLGRALRLSRRYERDQQREKPPRRTALQNNSSAGTMTSSL